MEKSTKLGHRKGVRDCRQSWVCWSGHGCGKVQPWLVHVVCVVVVCCVNSCDIIAGVWCCDWSRWSVSACTVGGGTVLVSLRPWILTYLFFFPTAKLKVDWQLHKPKCTFCLFIDFPDKTIMMGKGWVQGWTAIICGVWRACQNNNFGACINDVTQILWKYDPIHF